MSSRWHRPTSPSPSPRQARCIAPRHAGLVAAVLPGVGLAFLIGGAWAAGSDRGGDKSAKASPATTIAGVSVDWQRGVIEASASAAADLYAASADVARLKAERLARARAEDRLRRALTGLRSDPRLLARVPAGPSALDVSRATVSFIDYGSNGSVVLRLSLPLSPPPPAADKRGPTPDGGTPPSSPDLGATASDSHEN